jgi:hypothetical protein
MIQIDTTEVNFSNQEFLNLNFSQPFMSIPAISAIPVTGAGSPCNVEIFVSNLTTTGCTLNSSSRFTGKVRVVAVRG